MRNGQLKPAYNVQIAVNSEYITGVDVFSNRTDIGTLVPFLKQLKNKHKRKYAAVTADAGYESLENYLYLEANGQLSFIKPSNKEERTCIVNIENVAKGAVAGVPQIHERNRHDEIITQRYFAGCK